MQLKSQGLAKSDTETPTDAVDSIAQDSINTAPFFIGSGDSIYVEIVKKNDSVGTDDALALATAIKQALAEERMDSHIFEVGSDRGAESVAAGVVAVLGIPLAKNLVLTAGTQFTTRVGEYIGEELSAAFIDKVRSIIAGASDRQSDLQVQYPKVGKPTRVLSPTRENHALIIGNADYDSPTILDLDYPVSDCMRVRDTLSDSSMGDYHVPCVLTDGAKGKVEDHIYQFFNRMGPNHNALLYFSGHGFDCDDKLYLGVKDTQSDKVPVSAVSIDFIVDRIERSRCRSVIIILDCCHAGMVGQKLKDELSALSSRTNGASSEQYWMMGCDADARAKEFANLQGGAFTHYLLDGLKTGDADGNHDGRLTPREWFDHAKQQLDKHGYQEAQFWHQVNGTGSSAFFIDLNSALDQKIADANDYVQSLTDGKIIDETTRKAVHGFIRDYQNDQSFRIRQENEGKWTLIKHVRAKEAPLTDLVRAFEDRPAPPRKGGLTKGVLAGCALSVLTAFGFGVRVGELDGQVRPTTTFANAQIASLSDAVKDGETAGGEMQTRIASLSSVIRGRDTTIRSLGSENFDLTDEVGRLGAQLAAAQKAAADLEAQLLTSTDENDALGSQNRGLTQTNASLQTTLAGLQETAGLAEALSAANDKLTQTVEDMRPRLVEAERRASARTQEVANLKNSNATLSDRLETKTKSLDKSEVDLRAARNQISNLEDSGATSASQVADLREASEAQVRQISTLETQVYDLARRANIELERVVELRKQVGDLNATNGELETSNASLNEKIGDQEIRIANLITAAETSAADAREGSARLAEILPELDRLKGLNETAKRDNQTLAERVNSLRAQLVSALNDKTAADTQLAALQRKTTQQGSKIDDLTAKVSALNEDIEDYKLGPGRNGFASETARKIAVLQRQLWEKNCYFGFIDGDPGRDPETSMTISALAESYGGWIDGNTINSIVPPGGGRPTPGSVDYFLANPDKLQDCKSPAYQDFEARHVFDRAETKNFERILGRFRQDNRHAELHFDAGTFNGSRLYLVDTLTTLGKVSMQVPGKDLELNATRDFGGIHFFEHMPETDVIIKIEKEKDSVESYSLMLIQADGA